MGAMLLVAVRGSFRTARAKKPQIAPDQGEIVFPFAFASELQ
jgi:hypothetical protein